MKKIGWPGHGWKVTCHRCGFWFPSTEIQKEWTGLLVCGGCFETRHPQTLIKIRGEENFPTFTSKDASPDISVGICSVVTNSAFADMAGADCSQADKVTPTYTLLIDLFKNGHGNQ